jgi:hypothetical protein
MKKEMLAVLGIVCLAIGVVMFFNAGTFVPSTYCGGLLLGMTLVTSMLYEFATGILILCGVAVFLSNLQVGSPAVRTFTAVALVTIIFGVFITTESGFRGDAFCGTGCIASSGFYCSGLSYSHATGNLTMTLGQATGQSWQAWGVAYVPQGTSLSEGIPDVTFIPVNDADGALPSGATRVVSLPASAPDTPVGRAISGAIWACYVVQSPDNSGAMMRGNGPGGGCTSSEGTPEYVMIATLTSKAS